VRDYDVRRGTGMLQPLEPAALLCAGLPLVLHGHGLVRLLELQRQFERREDVLACMRPRPELLRRCLCLRRQRHQQLRRLRHQVHRRAPLLQHGCVRRPAVRGRRLSGERVLLREPVLHGRHAVLRCSRACVVRVDVPAARERDVSAGLPALPVRRVSG
jgi:hypothetical protein